MFKKEYQLYDSLWKAVIEEFIEAFFWYFFPLLAPRIDFFTLKFLDKDLPNLFAEMAGDGRTDVVIEAPTKDGEKFYFIFHIEVQGYYDKTFAERMFLYYYRLRDYYGERILSLAILTDDYRRFHPKKYEYIYPYGDNSITYRFNSFKIISKSDEELYIKGNVFSYVMLAVKRAIQHKKTSAEALMVDLKSLVKQLYSEGFSREQVRKLYDFIRFYGTRGDERLVKQLDEYQWQFNPNSKSMTISSAIAEHFKQEGFEKGLEKGIEKGIEKGVEAKAIRVVEKCLLRGMSIEDTADLTELPIEVIRAMAERLKQK